MKRILPLFCLALAALPLTGQAADFGMRGDVAVKILAGLNDPGDRFGRRHGDDDNGGGGARDENRGDNSINVAKSLASRDGNRVLDATRVSDTVYIVRVMTRDGRRVDLTVDVRSGRVSGG